ncbi:DUF805 domain-containing protein [Patescibacteria group bacterium]|nr:DUF805 domain-containing protein [Patescibacteria group bacterium]MBU1673028.1 DUF805 domain-containing protein [Patescibacteria group bacterium]MBU1963297.1 DUF805 domain-containing protein [Patescibacteria group bacterium]
MPKTKKKSIAIATDKSGWLFIGFVVIVGTILILYFTVWDNGQDGGMEESAEKEEVIEDIQEEDENINKKSEETDINSDIDEDEMETGIGGPEEVEVYGLDFTLEGYEDIEPVIQGDTYYYDLDSGNYLTVMPRDMKGIVLESLTITNEEPIDIKGAEGIKYTGKSAKDGSTTYIVLVERGDYLFHVTGSELFLDNIQNIIKFNN